MAQHLSYFYSVTSTHKKNRRTPFILGYGYGTRSQVPVGALSLAISTHLSSSDEEMSHVLYAPTGHIGPEKSPSLAVPGHP